jgi:hypothetical protein
MPYFFVTLNYRCPNRHGNRVHRVYHEDSQAAVKMRISRDDLVCYSCPPNPPLLSAEIDFESDEITDSGFRQMNVPLGADFSAETFL